MTDGGSPERGQVGILTTDSNLVVRSWDAALQQMTGIPAERAVGRRLDDVVPDLRGRGLMELIRDPLTSGSAIVLAPAIHRYLIPCPPSEASDEFDHMQQRVVIGALRNDDTAVGIVITIEDVTARMERERLVARRIRAMGPAERLEAVRQLSTATPDDLEQLTSAIGDEDWQVRRAAVRHLAAARDAALVHAVVVALRDGHRNFSLLSSALQLLTLTGVDLTDALVGLLREPDSDLRIQAALALGTQRTPAAAAALVDALDDPDANVRFHAIEALGKLGSANAIERLAAVVASRDFFLAFPAIEALVRIGDPVIAPRLTPLLDDAMLAGAAAEAIGRLGDVTAVPPLVAALSGSIAPVVAVVSAIAEIHRRCVRECGSGADVEQAVTQGLTDEGTRRVLVTLTQVPASSLRDMVVVVGWLRDAGVPPALARLLGSHEAHQEVIEAFVRFGSRGVDLLIAQLASDDADARRAAAVALGRIGDRRAVPHLLALLRDETRDAWVPVVGALAALGDRRAFEPLLPLLGDEDAGVRQAAIGALNSIGHPDTARHVRQLLDAPDAHTRESAVRIAGYFGYAECFEAFLARCRDNDESVRRAALEHLPYFDDARGFGELRHALSHDTPRARAAAAQALGAVSSADALELLRAAVADNDAWVRYFGAISLGRQGDRAATPPLVRLATSDPAHHVRVAAIEALGAIGGEDVLEALAPLARHDDRNIADAVMRALGRLRSPDTDHVVLEGLRSQDAARRGVAVDTITRWNDLAAIEPLRWTATADSDEGVATAALGGLTAIGSAHGPASRAAVDALVTMTTDPARRHAAIMALARLAPTAITWLAEAADVGTPAARVGAVEALGRMAHPLATTTLRRALEDPEEAVRRQAVAGLARVGASGIARHLSVLAQRDPSPLVRQAAAAALSNQREHGGGA